METGTTATSLGEQTLDQREGKDSAGNREISDISWAKDLLMKPPELVGLEDIRRTATQQVRGLLGKLLWGGGEQVQLTGTQGVAGVVVTVRWEKHLRGPFLI